MQTKWVNDLNGQPFIEMIKIPAGNFTMGSNESSYSSEKPERNVFLQDYYISKYPITNKQFYRFIQETGYSGSDSSFLQHWDTNPDGTKSPPEELLDHPVVYVNWKDCYIFCKTYGLTLPSEAQWEKAARGTDKRIFPWGNDEPNPAKPKCNFRNIFEGTTPVGTFDGSRESYNGIPIQKGTSPYGVEDMAGNVWEWCLDEWDSNWLTKMGEEPKDPCNCKRIVRQGLIIEQIRSLSIQHQEAEEQLPFSQIKDCGAVRGAASIPPTSAPPFATATTRRTGTTSTACVVASKEETEEQNPFRDTEYCGEVHGSTILSPTSAPPIAATTTRRKDSTTTALDVASKEEETEEQSPFSEKCCGEVRGTSLLLPTSTPPFASTSTRRVGASTSVSESASKEEEEKPQFPFQGTEDCGAVHGSSLISPTSVLYTTSVSIHRVGTTSLVSEDASNRKEEGEGTHHPFQDTKADYVEVHGSFFSSPTSVQPIVVITTQKDKTLIMDSGVVSNQQEVEEKTRTSLHFRGDLRGSSWFDLHFLFCRTFYRDNIGRSVRFSNLGFRSGS